MKTRSGFGWLELLIGILLLVLGVWTFIDPNIALTGMVIAYAVAAIIMGVSDIVLYIQVERFTGFGPIVSLISGILSVMVGVMLLVSPGAGKLILTLLFPIWFIAHCISRLCHVWDIRLAAGKGMYYFSIVVHCIGLVLGVMMLLDPIFTFSVIRCFAGAYLVLLGIDSVLTALSPLGKRR